MDRILLINSEPKAANELTFVLQHAGFQVLTADEHQQALAEIHETEPDVIIMPEPLTKSNGDETCIRIRQKSTVPLIILGEEKHDSAGTHFLEAGADVYLASPLHLDLLLAWVRSLLRRSKTRIPSPLTGEDKGEGDKKRR